MPQKIVQYQLAWNPQQGAQYRIKLENNSQWLQWVKVSVSELSIVALLFKESPVYFNPETGSIFTDEEPIGS